MLFIEVAGANKFSRLPNVALSIKIFSESIAIRNLKAQVLVDFTLSVSKVEKITDAINVQ